MAVGAAYSESSQSVRIPAVVSGGFTQIFISPGDMVRVNWRSGALLEANWQFCRRSWIQMFFWSLSLVGQHRRVTLTPCQLIN